MKKGNNFMFGLITIAEFAKEIKTPVSTIYSWKQSGDMPQECFKKIGGKYFVRIKQTQEWLDR